MGIHRRKSLRAQSRDRQPHPRSRRFPPVSYDWSIGDGHIRMDPARCIEARLVGLRPICDVSGLRMYTMPSRHLRGCPHSHGARSTTSASPFHTSSAHRPHWSKAVALVTTTSARDDPRLRLFKPPGLIEVPSGFQWFVESSSIDGLRGLSRRGESSRRHFCGAWLRCTV